jgi:hypothetical protein
MRQRNPTPEKGVGFCFVRVELTQWSEFCAHHGATEYFV